MESSDRESLKQDIKKMDLFANLTPFDATKFGGQPGDDISTTMAAFYKRNYETVSCPVCLVAVGISCINKNGRLMDFPNNKRGNLFFDKQESSS